MKDDATLSGQSTVYTLSQALLLEAHDDMQTKRLLQSQGSHKEAMDGRYQHERDYMRNERLSSMLYGLA